MKSVFAATLTKNQGFPVVAFTHTYFCNAEFTMQIIMKDVNCKPQKKKGKASGGGSSDCQGARVGRGNVRREGKGDGM